MSRRSFERLDVFNASVDFTVLADTIACSFGTGRAYLADQLRRASSSIVLNIAEGAGEREWERERDWKERDGHETEA